MKKFEFSSEKKSIFCGQDFYKIYKNSEFLINSDNIMNILSKGYEIRQSLKDLLPGEKIQPVGMYLINRTPLSLKNTGPNVFVGNLEFTANRLSGLVAAYAFENRVKFPTLQSPEANALGLTWDNTDEINCMLFLSAVTGSEHFYEQFKYCPLVCAIRKVQLKKMPIKPMVKIAKIKNPQGLTMAKVMMRNLNTVKILWKRFPGASIVELEHFLESPPQELRVVIAK